MERWSAYFIFHSSPIWMCLSVYVKSDNFNSIANSTEYPFHSYKYPFNFTYSMNLCGWLAGSLAGRHMENNVADNNDRNFIQIVLLQN